jgi:hypothetical protein
VTAPQKREPEQLEMHDLLFGPVRAGRSTHKVLTEAAQPEQSPAARGIAERLRIARAALVELERKTTAKRARAEMRRRA